MTHPLVKSDCDARNEYLWRRSMDNGKAAVKRAELATREAIDSFVTAAEYKRAISPERLREIDEHLCRIQSGASA